MFCFTLRSIKGVRRIPWNTKWHSTTTRLEILENTLLQSQGQPLVLPPRPIFFVLLQLWHLIPGRHDFLRHDMENKINVFVEGLKFWLSQSNRIILYCCFEISWGENLTECNVRWGSSPLYACQAFHPGSAHFQFTTISVATVPLELSSNFFNNGSLISEGGGQMQASHFCQAEQQWLISRCQLLN